jgi:hypothetical protein
MLQHPKRSGVRARHHQAGNQRRLAKRRGNSVGFSRLAAPFMEFAMRRANRKDLARLKDILET